MNSTKPTYIVAVSGGVDSVALLHMLYSNAPELKGVFDGAQIVVAHIDHGIRISSAHDREFVETLAKRHGYAFEYIEAKLGPEASEEQARDVRYAFFERLQNKYHANGVILAHHHSDVVETAILNLVRGTGRRGMASLQSSTQRIRPLLHLTKNDLLMYAESNGLSWVEDETNTSPHYTRNRIRQKLAKVDPAIYKSFTDHVHAIAATNTKLDAEVANLLQYKLRGKTVIARRWFVLLDHVVACEFVHALLTQLKVSNISVEMVEKVVIAIKVARIGTKIDIDKNTLALITKRSTRIVNRQTLKVYKI